MNRWPFGVRHHFLVQVISVSEVCVVHLVRKKNGLVPFRNFLESYLKNPAGIKHDLLILYKGFNRKASISPYEELLKDIPHSFLRVADFGFDLRSYFVAAKKHDSKYFCFLNSFSIILDEGWLLKLYRHISQPGVGMVGATGSWESIGPSCVRRIQNPTYKQLVSFLFHRSLEIYFRLYFDRFPNYHLRTNGFMISRDILVRIHRGVMVRKMHAHRLESGINSITKQVERMGLKALVVGKDGKGYERQEWDVSNTFRVEGQNNLLISDNQTRAYSAAEPQWQQKCEFFSWGKMAIESKPKTDNNR